MFSLFKSEKNKLKVERIILKAIHVTGNTCEKNKLSNLRINTPKSKIL